MAMNVAPFQSTDEFTMAGFNGKISDINSGVDTEITSALSGFARIETGSYVGTGTYGASNPNTLTFGFAPKLVIVFDKHFGLRPYGSSNGYWYQSFLWTLGQDEILSASTGTNFLSVSTNGFTFSWWYKSGVDSKQAENQLNKENTTYGYVAIG